MLAIKHEKEKKRNEFLSLVKPLASQGVIEQRAVFKYSFPQVEMQYESYYGINANLRYFVELVIKTHSGNNVIEKEFCVRNITEKPHDKKFVQMSVGLKNKIRILCKFYKRTFHLNDLILGKLVFDLIDVPLKKVFIAIIKSEMIEFDSTKKFCESKKLINFQIVDGSPVAGLVKH